MIHDMCCALLASSSLTGEKKLVMCISVDRRLSENILCPAVSRDIVLNPIFVSFSNLNFFLLSIKILHSVPNKRQKDGVQTGLILKEK